MHTNPTAKGDEKMTLIFATEATSLIFFWGWYVLAMHCSSLYGPELMKKEAIVVSILVRVLVGNSLYHRTFFIFAVAYVAIAG